MPLRRRTLLRGAALTAAASIPLTQLFRRRPALAAPARYGELVPDPDGLLDLPPGFSYALLEEEGDAMDDGHVVPRRADGMAAFAGPGGTVILMRNHEVSRDAASDGPFTEARPAPGGDLMFDPRGFGGVTRLVVDGESFARVSSNLVLAGTVRNCAGGPSPWGWLSCEENVDDGHGYVFLCPTDAEGLQPFQQIRAYGRFNHEAVAIDPADHAAYLTEDRGDGCLYRFVPDDPEDPFGAGRFQAMRVVGEPGRNLGLPWPEGERMLEVDWVDLSEPDPPEDTLRDEAQAAGAATIVRGEGIWYADGSLFVVSTTGGPVAAGQVFRYDPTDGDGGVLHLLAQSEDRRQLDMPDNLTVAPWGEVFLCEDGGGENYIRVLDASGEVCDFARNAASDSELAGACFSPDGRALFVNVQADGRTFVITGPFPTGEEPPAGDAGVADAGAMGAADAGVAGADAGLPSADGGTSESDGGGGCSATGSGAGGAVALGAALLVGRGLRDRGAPEDDDAADDDAADDDAAQDD